jgi:tetratricopeptide (TPR) repeat protein
LQWDADSGQLLLDFDDATIQANVAPIKNATTHRKEREKQAADWYALAEQLQETDAAGAEQAYRKAIELSPEPHYLAYNNLGALLSRDDRRSSDALQVFDAALEYFGDIDLLHYKRGVLLEHLDRLEEAAASYLRCIELNPLHDEGCH